MRNVLRGISVAGLLAFGSFSIGCGGGSANAGASVNSDGTVSADANASFDTPVGTMGAGAGASAGPGGAGAGAGAGATYQTVPTSSGGYVATTVPQGCREQWVHMPMLINFPTGGATIDYQNREILREMVATAQARNDISAVRVEGHTDTCGREINNMVLSQQRAVSVANELVSMGVPRERITTVGFGSSQPRANEDCARQRRDALSRETNRRVEFSLLVCR